MPRGIRRAKSKGQGAEGTRSICTHGTLRVQKMRKQPIVFESYA